MPGTKGQAREAGQARAAAALPKGEVPAFESNAGGAAFGNPLATKRAMSQNENRLAVSPDAPVTEIKPNTVTQNESRAAWSDTSEDARLLAKYGKKTESTPPPKADAAPKGDTMYAYVGLCDAMNAYEKSLVESKTVEYANQYVIEFAPKSLGDSRVELPGATDYTKTPSQVSDTAKTKLDPKTNTTNTKGKRYSITAGTQILQFIEITMRNSTYITDQLNATNDQLDVSKPSIPNANASNKETTWFNIIVNAVPIGTKKDKKRNDYPYKISYIIVPYAINEMQSQYFNDAQLRGVHKVYNYWFTGQNTQVLSFDQSYNNQFINVMGSKSRTQARQDSGNADLVNSIGYGIGPNRNVPSPSGETIQQASNDANNAAATGADYLYSFSDQKEVTLKIVGDPAWLVQGETKGITAAGISFDGFYPDGTVNPETQQLVFAINFNAPTDYNNGSSGPYSGTGLMDINSTPQNGNNKSGKSPTQASAAYTATFVKSTFSKGRFEQELKGNALKNLNSKQLAPIAARPADNKTAVAAEASTTPVIDETSRLSSRYPALVTAGESISNDRAMPTSSVRTPNMAQGVNDIAATDPSAFLYGVGVSPAPVVSAVQQTEDGYPRDETSPTYAAVGAKLQPLTSSPPASNGEHVETINLLKEPPTVVPIAEGSLRARRTVLVPNEAPASTTETTSSSSSSSVTTTVSGPGSEAARSAMWGIPISRKRVQVGAPKDDF